MKNTFRRYVSLLLSLVILFEGLLSCVSAVEETNKAEEANQITQTILNANEMTKEEMLSEAYRSLVKQKGERYYPIVEKMILDEYSKIESYSSTQDTLKRASTRIRIPNGGTVYYKDYLSTKTKVTKIYLNKSDSV